jgi:hypothetical protein
MPAASDGTMLVTFQSILAGFLAKGFDAEIKKMAVADGIVNATIDVDVDVYNRISLELLPTPWDSKVGSCEVTVNDEVGECGAAFSCACKCVVEVGR